jgi:hypothetical protein
MRKPFVLLIVLFAACACAAVVAAAVGDGPTDPPGLMADGSVDLAQLPAAVGVVGPDGRDVVCPNGRPLTVTRAQLLAPPTAPGASQRSEARMLAPRCGAGGSVVWVALAG